MKRIDWTDLKIRCYASNAATIDGEKRDRPNVPFRKWLHRGASGMLYGLFGRLAQRRPGEYLEAKRRAETALSPGVFTYRSFFE
ncbi:MAG: hypothetical protein ABIH92_02915 [Nanoarchaeota archaeon]